VATQLRGSSEETDIRIRYDEIYRDDLESIENLPIISSSGARISLKQVAQISGEKGPVKINREDQLRVVSVTANTDGRPVGDIVDDIKKKLDNPGSPKLPNGYFIEYGGSYHFRNFNDSFDFGDHFSLYGNGLPI
jgi:Cu/Ag efflux pump CusA